MSKTVMEPERPQTIWRMRAACWISKATRAQANARARAPTPTNTQAHACTHPRARKHTQTYVLLIASPRQQWLRERASILRYTYTACLV